MGESSVSVLLPVLNERATVEEALTSLLDQDYAGPIEIIIADGGSSDGTREYIESVIARGGATVRLIDNPRRKQAYGLNLAAEVAGGNFLTRADGHTTYAPDYVTRSVATAIDSHAAAGGPMNPVGTSWFSRCVAAAMNNPFTMGPARFHHATEREIVDTVYLGTFARTDFRAIGGFRALPSGAAEDADFYARWRASGRTVVVDPAIVSTYFPRSTPASLWSQYFHYGVGKAEMLWLNGSFPSLRPFAPLLFVLALVAGAILAVFGAWAPLALIVGGWFVVVTATSLPSGALLPGVIIAAATMHVAYGIGVAHGLIRGRPLLSAAALSEE